MNKELFDAFDEIVVKTIAYRNSLNKFLELSELKDFDEPGFFVRNFCTSVINTGRMSGKTTYAANKCVIKTLNKLANVVSVGEFINVKFWAENIIIDDYKNVFNNVDEKMVFSVIASNGCSSVLLLG
jgi:hypothetical protein